MHFIISVAIALTIGFLYWLRKLTLKRRLREGLGREVSDHELTSLTAWMEATPKNKPGSKPPKV
jgi:hypothetical protein